MEVLYYAVGNAKNITEYEVLKVRTYFDDSIYREIKKYYLNNKFRVVDSSFYCEAVTANSLYKKSDFSDKKFRRYLRIDSCISYLDNNFESNLICYDASSNDSLIFLKRNLEIDGASVKLIYDKQFKLLREEYYSGYSPYFRKVLLNDPPIELISFFEP
jgi:hypothetical protein